ncbi:hypothetical protein C2845_PM04G22290 [Panicum miliaceum]|uniref:Solute carrier family 35 member F2-like n=1 Tax=Panicum miliaceum TaxID=4540 RepID=A0A3L6QSP5_PANMI|nr:hypothetical protein C2845_PM04G22290 [Panicum miliaceum]
MAPPPWWLRREVLVGLALGQFVSLLITSTGFSSSELARRGVNAPTSQSLLNYILLALVYGGTLIYKRRHLTVKWYYYLLLSIIDVEANYIEGPNPLKGDLLVIGGSMLYAISNVTEEYFVKKSNRVEVMAMLGVFGAIISGIQIGKKYTPIFHFLDNATEAYLNDKSSDQPTGMLVRGSKQIAEETAQVTGAGDEEAATANRTAQVPCVGDDGPSSNKEFASAATASR